MPTRLTRAARTKQNKDETLNAGLQTHPRAQQHAVRFERRVTAVLIIEVRNRLRCSPSIAKTTVEPEDLGLFSLALWIASNFFRSRIDAIIQSCSDPECEQAQLSRHCHSAYCDSNAKWYQLMGSTQRTRHSAGRPNDREARRLADTCRWNTKTETMQEYLYAKLSLLRPSRLRTARWRL